MEMQLPPEIYDAIAFFVENAKADRDPFGEHDPRRYKIRAPKARPRLAALRLVSKAFCSVASRRLFRHIIAVFNDSKLSPLVRLHELSNSPYAVYVRRIDLGFGRQINMSWEDTLKEYHLTYVEDLGGLLPGCLVRFPNLSSLDFRTGGSTLGLDCGPALGPPLEKTRIFINTIAAALHYVPLQNLTELQVALPTARDFWRLFNSNPSALRISIEDVLRGLRHLRLEVLEYANFQQRDGPVAVSPENAALPNESHAIHLFKAVELAANLNSLAIHAMDVLNLDNIQFGRSLRLRSLSLRRVAISSETLLSLIEQGKETLRSVDLQSVQLNSGTWQDVLLQMSKLPHLVRFSIILGGYSLTGTSSNLAIRLPLKIELETLNSLDKHALGNLQRHVNANRAAAGFHQHSKQAYRYLETQSLESVMEAQGLGGQGST